MSAKLENKAIRDWLKDRDGWKMKGKAIRKDFSFKSFRSSIVFAAALGVALAFVPLLAVHGVESALALGLLLPLGIATGLMSGILFGYVIYDLSHYYTHHARPKAKYGKYLKAWHLAHHHKWWTRMYGVSSPFWDLVFRTGKP